MLPIPSRVVIVALLIGLTCLGWLLTVDLGVRLLYLRIFLGEDLALSPAFYVEYVLQWILLGLTLAAMASVAWGFRHTAAVVTAWWVGLALLFLGGLPAFGVHAMSWLGLIPLIVAAGLVWWVTRRTRAHRPGE